MAWLWKQGRPTLLAIVGAGPGLQSVPPGASAGGTEHQRWGCGTRPPRTRRGQHPRQLPHRHGLSRRPQRQGAGHPRHEGSPGGRLLSWAAQLAYYLLFAVFPFFLFFDRPAGVSAHSQPDGAHHRRAGHGLPGRPHAPPGQHPAARDGAERRAAVLRDSGRAVVLLQCRGGDHGGPEPGL